jgi:hypothetical protein
MKTEKRIDLREKENNFMKSISCGIVPNGVDPWSGRDSKN